MGRAVRTFVLALIAILSAAAARADDAGGRPPDRVVGQAVSGFAAAPQGSTGFGGTDIAAINVWALIVRYWPEVTSGLAFLTAALWLRRLRGRRQIKGEPYCRCCNYHLAGL